MVQQLLDKQKHNQIFQKTQGDITSNKQLQLTDTPPPSVQLGTTTTTTTKYTTSWVLTGTQPGRETRLQQQPQVTSAGWLSKPQSHAAPAGRQSSASACTVGSQGDEPPETQDLPIMVCLGNEPPKTWVLPIMASLEEEPPETQDLPITACLGEEPPKTWVLPIMASLEEEPPETRDLPITACLGEEPPETQVLPIMACLGEEPPETQVLPIIQMYKTQVLPIMACQGEEPPETWVLPIMASGRGATWNTGLTNHGVSACWIKHNKNLPSLENCFLQLTGHSLFCQSHNILAVECTITSRVHNYTHCALIISQIWDPHNNFKKATKLLYINNKSRK